MKQLLILSGKGGTGKTTIASAFIKIGKINAYADCDVDAPNLHLTLHQKGECQKSEYYGMPKAKIDPIKCVNCQKCLINCRFGAIKYNKKEIFIDPFVCEGCGVCEMLCGHQAIELKETIAGDVMVYKDLNHVFSTAQLKMGNGTTGKLVTEVKQNLKKNASQYKLAIIDGSPGIGCPVIASISGVDLVLIVTEPTLSGISDLKRIVKTTKIFGVKILVCINKFNVNIELTDQIELYCHENNILFAGKIPFDNLIIGAVNKNRTIVDIDCKAKEAVIDIYNKALLLLK